MLSSEISTMDISASHADATRNNASFVGSKRKLAGDNEIEDSSSDDFIDAHVRHRQRPTVDQWLAPQRRSHEPFCDQGRDAEFNGAPPVSDDANSTSSQSNERAERRKPDWAQGSANASDSNFGADQKPRDVSLSDEQKVVFSITFGLCDKPMQAHNLRLIFLHWCSRQVVLDHIMSGKSVFITGFVPAVVSQEPRLLKSEGERRSCLSAVTRFPLQMRWHWQVVPDETSHQGRELGLYKLLVLIGSSQSVPC